MTVPLVVWLIAFLVWFYWYDIAELAGRHRIQPKPAPKAARKTEEFKPRPQKRAGEDIPNEDRRRLEDIINKRR
ncbi:MAG TPA: hypothetical protein VIR79_05175 [Nitrospira sp.]